MFDTAVLRSGYQLKDQVDFSKRIMTMLYSTLNIDPDTPVSGHHFQVVPFLITDFQIEAEPEEEEEEADEDEEEVDADDEDDNDEDSTEAPTKEATEEATEAPKKASEEEVCMIFLLFHPILILYILQTHDEL